MTVCHHAQFYYDYFSYRIGLWCNCSYFVRSRLYSRIFFIDAFYDVQRRSSSCSLCRYVSLNPPNDLHLMISAPSAIFIASVFPYFGVDCIWNLQKSLALASWVGYWTLFWCFVRDLCKYPDKIRKKGLTFILFQVKVSLDRPILLSFR